MEKRIINEVQCYAPSSSKDLINFAFANKSILIAINVEKILKSPLEIKKLINKNIGYPDGIGAVWALKKKGLKQAIKIPGCELWLDIVEHTYQEKTFYFVGGAEEVIQKTIAKLKSQFPDINILNYRNGYIKTDFERKELIDDICQRRPDVIFVAMGSPKQEGLMKELHSKHKAVYQGLGGSFDLYVGNVKKVPEWWKKIFKWEGLYRSFNDLTNLKRWKRQTIIFKFFYMLFTNKI